jgi:hypothetical protein
MFPQQEEVMESAVRESQVATVLLQHEALEEPITVVAGIPLQQEAVDVTQQEAMGDGQLQTTNILRPVPEITSSMHTQQFDVGIEAPFSPVNSEHFSSNEYDIVRDLGQPYVIHAANRTRRPPNHFGEWAQIKDTHPSFLGATESFQNLSIEPESYDQAMSSLEQIEWQKAMAEEYDSLMKNHTWILADLPPWRKAVKSKWVYKVKTTVDGTLEQYKARLVAKDRFQKPGIDFTETFAPIARFESIRAFLSIAAAENMDLIQFDIKTAFLHGALSEEIYMEQPRGFQVPESMNKVCKLLKSLYGLWQASRAWNPRFHKFLTDHNLEVSEADPCLCCDHSSPKLMILIFVDDGLGGCTNPSKFMNINFRSSKGV